MSKQPLFTHLIWDFDGTLYDSYQQITCAMLAALREWMPGDELTGTSFDVLALLKRSVYYASLVLAERFFLPAQDLLDSFRKHHSAISEFPLFEGAARCLQALRERGCKHYLYTHRDRGALRQLEKDGLLGLFTGAITREDPYPDKPAPDALEALFEKWGIDSSSVVMIGDRDLDIEAGHRAGIQGILIDPQGFFSDLAVEYRVQSILEVSEIILRQGFRS